MDWKSLVVRNVSVKWTPRRIAFHIFMFIIVMVVLTSISIWLGLGPIVISSQA